KMIAGRPDLGVREELDTGDLDVVDGLVGDTWRRRSSRRTADGSPHPDMQLNVMNTRVVALGGPDPTPGPRVALGAAVIEVTAEPHTGCAKFVSRFGVDAMKFVNGTI